MRAPLLVCCLLLFAHCDKAAPALHSPIVSDSVGTPSHQEVTPAAAPMPIPDIWHQLYAQYERYQEPAIKTRRFKHVDIVPLIQRLKAPFQVMKAGKSIEGRDIYRIRLGDGPIQVLLWSQMHGDEPTATMAMLDIFNFFSRRGDEFDNLRRRILSEMTLTFVPMLNPDGAERYQRRNALDIDLNRDALRLQCPESQLLKQLRDELRADWGFNLHDQSVYYGAGIQPKTATISFLAPAYNYEKEVNDVRANAMKLIGLLNELLQVYIPGQVGRYDDTFEPRAFGDNMQKWGTSTILIECGGQPKDPEKQYIRKLNFVILLSAFEAIAARAYESANLAAYDQIPFNAGNTFFDLIVRDAQVQKNGKWYTVDIGLRHNEVGLNANRSFYQKASIAELGDMSIFYGYNELDARGYQAVPGKVYPTVLQNVAALRSLDATQLLRQGYTDVRLRELPKNKKRLPVNLLEAGKSESNTIRLHGNPSFVLQKNGQIRYAIVNGFAYDLDNDRELIRELINQE